MSARIGWAVSLLGLTVLGLVPAAPARAEVTERHPDGFTLRSSARADAGWAQAYFSVRDVGHWWNAAHTYSGDAANLSLALEPGGCLCERLADGSTFEHGRVVSVDQRREVRLDAPLGPLKGKASRAELVFSWATDDRGNLTLVMSFEVDGQGLGAFADPVDQVMTDQFQRWAAWAPQVRLTVSAPTSG